MTTNSLPLYTCEQVRELDRLAIEQYGIAGISLMKRAAQATYHALIERWPAVSLITVYCGGGNNGGDGYLIAALAQQRNIAVNVVQLAPKEHLQGDARTAFDYAQAQNVSIIRFEHSTPPTRGIVVDALLGTGLKNTIRAPYDTAVNHMNNCGLPVVAVDIPSGLCANTGSVLGCTVKAELTVSYVGRKQGLMTASGPAYSGQVVFDDLAIPAETYTHVASDTRQLAWPPLARTLPTRQADAHKGLFGHVMIIGGDKGTGGAALLAAEAALAVGAGLVSVATQPEHVSAMIARCPELMAVGVISGQELEPLLERPSLLIVGPGLGQSPWSEQMLQKALASNLPMVVDADALNILSQGRLGRQHSFATSVFTPHPGEAARLLGETNFQIQQQRFSAVQRLQKQFGTTVVLKGAGTLIATATTNSADNISTKNQPINLCPYGNAGMATGGMGDVLSGVIGGLMAQGLPAPQAADVGVCLHSVAADNAATEHGIIGLRASELMPFIRNLRNERHAN